METNKDKLLGQVKSCLSSLLVMSKTGYSRVSLEEDYKEMVGKRLADDIRPLGFTSVSDFLGTIPDVVRKAASGWGGDVYRAVGNESTRHIQQLVDNTPASKSKGRKRGKPRGGWQRSQIRSYSPPSRNRRMGPSYGFDDDDVWDFGGGGSRFDFGDDISDDDFNYSNYRKEYAPVVVKSASTSHTIKEAQVASNSMFSTPPPSSNWAPISTNFNNNAKLSQGSGVIASEVENVTPNTKVAGPVIPSVGSYFDVVVTMAVSPDKFTVQPYMESHNLKTLSTDMKAFYQETGNQPEENLQCKVGDCFAASNMGGEWYRMMVTKVVNNFKVAVKYIDFGYQSVTDKSKLRTLHPRFENLPIQAVGAKLAGAHSRKHEVWTLKDKVWFNQRVVNNQFVSIVKEVEQTSDGVVLTLELIDTSNPMEDVYVLNQLLERE